MAAILSLVLSGTGCQSNPTTQPTSSKCTLAAGMTTDQLSACGCFLANPVSHAALSSNVENTQSPTNNIIIENYFCPLGPTGLAKVVVMNGISQRVFN